MAKVYDEPRDVIDVPIIAGDHAIVVSVPQQHREDDMWLGHIVKIERIQEHSDGSWMCSIKMLYANPNSTWGLIPSCLRRVEFDSADYAMAEARDRQYRAAKLQANAERLSAEARTEMFEAQQCWARAASINAMKGF